MFKVDKNFMRANIQKSIRFTEELDEMMNEIVKKTGVSFNSLVLQCCCYALEHMDDDMTDDKADS